MKNVPFILWIKHNGLFGQPNNMKGLDQIIFGGPLKGGETLRRHFRRSANT